MKDKSPDPRDIAYLLDMAALRAFCQTGNSSGATVTISAELAYKIAEYLHRVPRNIARGQAPLSMRERNYRRALVTKARRRKAELVAKGMNKTEAEAQAAEELADGCAVETFQRAMQNRTDNG